MTNYLALPNRYPGLAMMAKFIGPYIPKSQYYVEPCAGLARTAKYARSGYIVLNDKSKSSNEYCRKKFPTAIIENLDFIECIKKYDGPDTFFLIDPVWRTDFYKGKGIRWRKEDKKSIHKPFVDRTAKQYLKDLALILPTLKGHYILTLPQHFECRKSKGKTLFPSPFSKLLRHPKPLFFKNHPSTRLFSNKPLIIQVPQITDYLE